jgi:hypothetical protein
MTQTQQPNGQYAQQAAPQAPAPIHLTPPMPVQQDPFATPGYAQGPRVAPPQRAAGMAVLNFHPIRGSQINGVWQRPAIDPNGGDYGFFGKDLLNRDHERRGLSLAAVNAAGLTGEYVLQQLCAVDAQGVIGLARLTGDGANGSVAIPAPGRLAGHFAWIAVSFEAIGALLNNKNRSGDGLPLPRLGTQENRVSSIRRQLRSGQLQPGTGGQLFAQPQAPAGPYVAPQAQPIVPPAPPVAQPRPQPAAPVQPAAAQLEPADEPDLDFAADDGDENPLAL